MAVVLLKVFEEASLSGELKLSGRKLKDFPKAVGKYNLSDTVIADLSRNRLCELPEDVTGFPFLETLLMYHNTLRTIPETIRGLHSLTFLDLRSNLLTTLPRELCFLPIQVLLVSNNRLVSLPEELGRMEELTELDAACNQITHLPARMSDLKSLKSLSLRNNHLVYLPRDVTCLNLVLLDISCNRIATLPVELRLMTNLVRLELDSNPLTSPPASLCVRGLVHVFKFLDTMAIKEEKSKAGGSFDGHTTLRRNAAAKHSNSAVSDIQKMRRHNVDSGYSTSDGFDKRWSQELPPNGSAAVAVGENANSKWSPTPLHIRTSVDKNSPTAQNNNPNHSSSPYQQQTSATSTPNHSPAGNNNISSICNNSVTDEFKRPANPSESSTPKRSANSMNGSSNSSGSNNSNDVSPDGDFTSESQKSGDKLKSLGNIQTYREYKEALRQQRNQDSNAIYRPKDSNQITPQDSTPPSASTNDSPLSQLSSSFKSNTSTPSPTSTSNPNSPISPQHTSQSNNKNVETSQHTLNNTGNLNHSNGAHVVANGTSEAISNSTNSNIGIGLKSPLRSDKPIQKVTPSRNSAPIKYHHQVTSPTNGNQSMIDGSGNKSNLITAGSKDCGIYVKPNSPVKPNATSNGSSIIGTSTAKSSGKGTQKSPRSVSWNRDIPSEKLSFTMRREFDRQKEESELIEQLRSTIESRLKMSLPKDVASALTDGVVLCHLANHVRPRSVASIHVPSPAVPKLTMARCRRNVDNFLDACRKIGVDEELICSCADIVPSDGLMSLDAAVMDDNKTTTTHTASPRTGEQATSKSIEHSSGVEKHHSAPPNLSAMFQTIAALIDIGDKQSSYGRSTSHSPATNTKIPANNSSKGSSRIEEIHNYNQYFKTVGIHFQKTSTLLLQHEQQSELLTADHLNEYSLIDDYDNNDFVPNEDSVYDVNQAALLNSESSRFCGSESIATTNNELIPSSQDADNSNNHITEHARYNFNNHKRAHDFSSHSDSNKNINSRHSVNNNNNNENKNSFDEWPVRRSPRKTPNTLDLSLSNTTVLNVNNANATTNSGTFNTLTIKKRKMSNNKRNFSQIGNSGKYSEQFPLNGIVEECEYDSDIGKFNCKVGNAATDQITSDNSSGSYDFSEENIRTSSGSSSDERTINDLNASPKQRSLQPIESTEEFNINATIDCTKKIVMKRIEFFENNSNGNGTECKVVNINVMDEDVVDGSAAHVADNKTKQLAQQTITSDTRISTILCLSSFVFVVVILYFFPLPA